MLIFLFLGKIFLHHPRNLPKSVHHEGDRGVCRGTGAVEAAVFPQARGAQAEQGGERAGGPLTRCARREPLSVTDTLSVFLRVCQK